MIIINSFRQFQYKMIHVSSPSVSNALLYTESIRMHCITQGQFDRPSLRHTQSADHQSESASAAEDHRWSLNYLLDFLAYKHCVLFATAEQLDHQPASKTQTISGCDVDLHINFTISQLLSKSSAMQCCFSLHFLFLNTYTYFVVWLCCIPLVVSLNSFTSYCTQSISIFC